VAITPFEAFEERKPNVSNIRIFGCAAYALQPSAKPPVIRKWDPRIRAGQYIYVGMKGSSIWRLLNLTNLKEELSSDVQFNEYSFPELPELADMTRITDIRPPPLVNPPSAALPGNTPGMRQPVEPLLSAPGETTFTHEAEGALAPGALAPRDAVVGQQSPVAPRTEEPPLSTLEVRETIPLSQPVPARRRGRPRKQLPDVGSGGAGAGAGAPMVPLNFVQPTRSGRIPRKTVFSDAVLQLVSDLNAVYLSDTESLSVQVPLSFEGITVEQAIQEDAPGWQRAMAQELQSLHDTHTYIVVNIPSNGRKVIKNKWVLKNKLDEAGALQRRKARLVIKGYEQVYGLDYTSTFASVVRFSTLRALLAKAAVEDLEVDQMDVDTAFLNPDLEEEVYMEIPDYFDLLYADTDFTGKCLRLKKALYGLKQASRAWFKQATKYF
jgi:hypothetical protein